MLAKIKVYLKGGILDPQGLTVKKALENLGFRNLNDVRIGKYIEINIDKENKDDAISEANEMCKKLLANPIIENYQVEVEEI